MKITVFGKQMTVRETLKAEIDRKLKKFDKFFGEETEAAVVCKVRKGVKIIEITVFYGGRMFRSEEESDTFLTALDRSVENLERQIRKNKTRLEKTVRRGAFVIDEGDNDEFDEEGEFDIRVKTYSDKPMTPEDAILEMNLSGHSFFVFRNAADGKTAVVFRRKDGGYGLLVPEI